MMKKMEVNVGAICFDTDTKTLQVVALAPFSENFCGWHRYACQLVEDCGTYRLPRRRETDSWIDDKEETDWNESDTILFNRIVALALEIVGVNTHSRDGFVLEDSVWWSDNKEAVRIIA